MSVLHFLHLLNSLRTEVYVSLTFSTSSEKFANGSVCHSSICISLEQFTNGN